MFFKRRDAITPHTSSKLSIHGNKMKEEDKKTLENELLNLAKEGSLEKIEDLFKRAEEDNKNINVNIRDKEGNTPLMFATINGNEELMEFLIKKGASLRLTNNQEQSAEELALEEWRDDDEDRVFNFLQDEAIRLRKETLRKRFSELDQKLLKSAKDRAERFHNNEVLDGELLAEDEAIGLRKETLRKRFSKLDQKLLKSAKDPAERFHNNEVLHGKLLAEVGNFKISNNKLDLKNLERLLDLGADPNQIFSETKSGEFGAGNTLLHKAALCSDPKVAELLLKFGADPFIVNELGKTPLDLATEKNKATIDVLLVGQNKWKKKYLDPALFEAISNLATEDKNLDLSEVGDALDNGANPNAIHETGNTPLHGAAHFKDPRLAIKLLGAGATLNIKNKEGKTPLQIAMEQGNIEVIKTFTHNNPVERLATKVNIFEDVDKVDLQSPTSVTRSLSPSSKEKNR